MSALAALHVTAKKAGLNEDARRDVYARVTGKRSAKDMSDVERWAVVEEIERLHPQLKDSSRRPDGRAKLSGKYAPKLQALWIAGWNLGAIRNKDDAALEAFVKRQTGLDAVRFCRHPEDAKRAIEAIKAMLARDAAVDWSVGEFDPTHERLAGVKIAAAQWARLKHAGVVASDAIFIVAVQRIVLRHPCDMTAEKDWHPVMNAWGQLIRRLNR